ncbi:hypothetical protein RHMOL_Rhmol13G0129300 [Rhododendron molle]|uniref:Uncharacterized protein n=1 Tax=Rhododendron molle TaxID=49168 RepID=A0ACC0L643_RHOML|nr:hypothetical protein RHMOL_Rhmol13G0129300 [Rhododendron molle]
MPQPWIAQNDVVLGVPKKKKTHFPQTSRPTTTRERIEEEEEDEQEGENLSQPKPAFTTAEVTNEEDASMIADHHHQRTPTSFEPQSLISISNAQEGLNHHRRRHTPTKCVVPASAGYSGNYGNPEARYAANPYQASYGGIP